MFPVPDSKSMPWILAKSVDVKENNGYIRSFDWYSYYVGINLMSRDKFKEFVKSASGVLLRAFLKRIGLK